MSAVSLVILPVNAVFVLALEDVVVVALLDIAGALVMVEGVTVHVGDPPNVAACHLVVAAIASRHRIVDARSCHMPTEMVSGNDAGAGAEHCKLRNITLLRGVCSYVCLLCGISFRYLKGLRSCFKPFWQVSSWFCFIGFVLLHSPVVSFLAVPALGSSILNDCGSHLATSLDASVCD
ncbi:hypothetical protein F0562_007613 [Nyssa sinensis]|uniref:Uncharacterized protein n=1 Tax=Nyssa sinensis TaxID=561372 RepID=A0A5J5A8P0_9ASTE|nr:hypothetical protein F0562_007613 [Nyssa sinensis]